MHPVAPSLSNTPICSPTPDHPPTPPAMTLMVSLSQLHQTTALPVPTDFPPYIHCPTLYHSIPVASLHSILMPTNAFAHAVPSTHPFTHMKCQHGNPCLHLASYPHTPNDAGILPNTHHLSTPIPAPPPFTAVNSATVTLNQLFPIQCKPLLPCSHIGLLHTRVHVCPTAHSHPSTLDPDSCLSSPATTLTSTYPQIVPGYMPTLTHSRLHSRLHTPDFHPLLGILAPSYTQYSHSSP